MWKEKYRIGIELVDEQHKELFKRLSDFIEVIQNEKDWDEKLEQVNKTMLFMQEYVIFHFNDEEDYMAKINYPEIENHVSTHNLFREWIVDCLESFYQDGFTEENVQEFGGKIIKWLILHVGRMDQKIGEFVRKQSE